MAGEDQTRNKGGRPPKAEKMRDNVLHVYFQSREAINTLEEAAQKEGLSVSAWSRSVLLREAGRILGQS